MSILSKLQAIPGVLIYNEQKQGDYLLLDCKYNWVYNLDDKGLIQVSKSPFANLTWTKADDKNISKFLWGKNPFEINLEVKSYYGFLDGKLLFSINFGVDLPIQEESEDYIHIQAVIENFHKVKGEINQALSQSLSVPN